MSDPEGNSHPEVANGLGENGSKDASPIHNSNVDLNSDSESEAREQFEIWCKKFDRTYPDEDEKLYRFGIFKKELEWVNRKNQELHRLGESSCYGINGLSDLTNEELFCSNSDSDTDTNTEEPSYLSIEIS